MIDRTVAVRVTRQPDGPRVYLAGMRLHHGLTGVALVAVGALARRPLLALVGCALALDDAHDFPWPLRDRNAEATQ